ncbi:MAG: hypothetical protein NTV12_02315, partial [Verrucomicrobia bacterium]|nr:hypothetical protein [Verrucomicrobiota bacterium]
GQVTPQDQKAAQAAQQIEKDSDAAKAVEGVMRTLRSDGWIKVMAGQTTIEEVLRVTQSEEHMGALVEDLKP